MAIETFDITCVGFETIAPLVRHIKFTRSDNKKFPFIPGQFITLHFQSDGHEVKRSYSVAVDPGESDYIEFALSYMEGGIASEKLFHIEPGETLTCSGPFGRLILPDEDPARYIFVATSTGVTPYKAMLREIANRLENPNLEVHLLLGVRKKEDILYESHFCKYDKMHPNFHFTAHLSREKNGVLSEHQKNGYVQNYFTALSLNPTKDLVYLCGNPEMIDTAYSELKEIGFTPRNVKREKYISKK